MTLAKPPTIMDVGAHFVDSFGITNASSLDWEDVNVICGIGETRFEGQAIWIRTVVHEMSTSSGPMRELTVEFTTDSERRLDRYNCPIICSVVGTEKNIGTKRTFEFQLLPLGRQTHLSLRNEFEFRMVAEILLHFAASWREFGLDQLK